MSRNESRPCIHKLGQAPLYSTAPQTSLSLSTLTPWSDKVSIQETRCIASPSNFIGQARCSCVVGMRIGDGE
ncbi:hypothetical protein M407DRAFT_93672 [Tulasnella calospora MUT 4182]|uniref:Uncharacterized protein n=1 Tax=Tulasnella calospora MUT 4182 TaxID=1051891 RepID=A0A0C3KUG4_9AGAM|nr:hypothetical protein M407DRAFT_93672 [Tulasnella calospora MUT 4182]